MDQKQEIMVSLGAAVGANCIPCFDFLYGKAKEVGLADSEIKKTVEAALKVKTGAATFMKNALLETVGRVETPEVTCCEAFNAQKDACCSNG